MSETITEAPEISIRQEGAVGRITLQRPQALNAMTYDMMRSIDVALIAWAKDESVALVMIDAEGDRAFCAGGDIADLYANGKAGNFAFSQDFWAEEYRMNARIAAYPKPVVTFLQGFTMGGGVGLGCHASHRIVSASSQIAMPECGIGLVPDVGGSFLLARAGGAKGVFMGLTGARMNGKDAIMLGFADHFVPEQTWEDLKAEIVASGTVAPVAAASSQPTLVCTLTRQIPEIEEHFSHATLADIAASLAAADPTPFTVTASKALNRNSPLAMGCCHEILKRLRSMDIVTMGAALDLEYRYTYRAMEQGDFLEGIRAQIIDKDRNPKWADTIDSLTQQQVDAMLAPLGNAALTLEEVAA